MRRARIAPNAVGGREARGRNIPFHEPSLGSKETRAMLHAVQTGQLGGNSAIAQRVEAQLCALLGVRTALLVSSGTASLELALVALAIRSGDVIMPSFGFPSMAAVVVAAGARPVFVDIDPTLLTLDPDGVKRAISSRTRAIMFVDYGGAAGTLESVHAVAMRHGIPLIEDAAHALGSTLRHRPLGSWGRIGCFSFDWQKIVTCGEGGVLVTNDASLARAAAVYREYGTNRAAFNRGEVDHYEWVGPGSNRLLAGPLAALLEPQLATLRGAVAQYRRMATRYLMQLAPLARAGDLHIPQPHLEAAWNGQIFFVLMRDEAGATQLIETLARQGIDARRHFLPLHRSAYGTRVSRTVGQLRITESVCARLVRLPLYHGLTIVQQDRVIRTVKEYVEGLKGGCGRRIRSRITKVLQSRGEQRVLRVLSASSAMAQGASLR